jgi:lipoprotein-anchoring transpeptidase ErfK/SrfK
MIWRKIALGFAVLAALATGVPAEAGFFRDLVDNMDLPSGPLIGNGGANGGNAGNSGNRQPLFGSGLNLNLSPGGAFYPEDVNPNRVAPRQFRRQVVDFKTNEAAGTIVVNPRQHFLYYVLGNGQAIRYGIGVGREGFGWSGTVTVGRKAEWPTWTPPPEMVAREKARGRILPASMDGGPNNPLGARALYLYRGGNDTMYRIHGTSEPWTIGLNVSSGCIRMLNKDVVDLYNRARVGAKVVVL